MAEHSVEKGVPEWPEPPARVYPHRYGYCAGCSRVVRDFQGDAVWRDREGGTLCMSKGLTFHRVTPPADGDPS